MMLPGVAGTARSYCICQELPELLVRSDRSPPGECEIVLWCQEPDTESMECSKWDSIVGSDVITYSRICEEGLDSAIANVMFAPGHPVSHNETASKKLGRVVMDIPTYIRVLTCDCLRLFCMRKRWRHLISFMHQKLSDIRPARITHVKIMDSRGNLTTSAMPGMYMLSGL